MRLLFCGDIVGRSGREALKTYLPLLKQHFHIDGVIANGENASHGFGLTASICRDAYAIGVDVLTSGNHIWDKLEIAQHIGTDDRLIRPANYPPNTPGKGFTVFQTANHKKVLVINAMGRLFMDLLDDPFRAVDLILQGYHLGKNIDAIIVDFHAEATSEKAAMGYFCDGRVSFVIGTHTHVPTADMRILPSGTAFQSDAGMCGDYNSIVGMNKDVPLAKFLKGMKTEKRMEPATGEGTLCGVLVTLKTSGLAESIRPIRLGGMLHDPILAQEMGI